jgi:hypothetical protein
MLKAKNLLKAATGDSNLKPFADLADRCLTPDFRLRPTPGELLKEMREQRQS